MRKNFLLLFIGTLFVLSCKKESDLNSPILSKSNQLLKSTAESNALFAKALSEAIYNVELREIIKSESLLMFDKDNDVLFSRIKDKKLSTGETIIDYLSNYSELAKEQFKQQINGNELLTIYVPSLRNFTPDTWETQTQIPVIAVRNESDIALKNKLQAFDSGQDLSLSYFEEPKVPALVVKNNERLISENDPSFEKFMSTSMERKGIKTAARSVAGSNNKLYFRSSNFDNYKLPTFANAFTYYYNNDTGKEVYTEYKDGQGPGLYLGKLFTGYFKKYSFSFDRDCIYYSLKNDTDSGAFDNTYAEAIHGFYFNNALSETTLDALNNDWTEGVYEVYITILFVEGTAVKDVKKGFSVSKNDLFMYKNGRRVSKYFAISPIEIASWDMQKYGDSWKFLIEEYNYGEVKKYNTNVTSNFSSNFKAEVGVNIGIVKIGASGGISTSTTKSSTFEITTTTSSFNLGEAILDFDDPIEVIGKNEIAKTHPVQHWVDSPLGSNSTRTKGLNTGLVTLIVAPYLRIALPSDDFFGDGFYWMEKY